MFNVFLHHDLIYPTISRNGTHLISFHSMRIEIVPAIVRRTFLRNCTKLYCSARRCHLLHRFPARFPPSCTHIRARCIRVWRGCDDSRDGLSKSQLFRRVHVYGAEVAAVAVAKILRFPTFLLTTLSHACISKGKLHTNYMENWVNFYV